MLDESDMVDTLGYPMEQNLFSSKYLTIRGVGTVLMVLKKTSDILRKPNKLGRVIYQSGCQLYHRNANQIRNKAQALFFFFFSFSSRKLF